MISDRVILHVNFLYGVFRTLRSQTWFIVLEEPPDVLGGLSSISRSLKVLKVLIKFPRRLVKLIFFSVLLRRVTNQFGYQSGALEGFSKTRYWKPLKYN